MIVRTWSARATKSGAADYRNYFEHTLLPELRALPGFVSALLLSRELDGTDTDTVELTAHTTWESLAAIQSFAGADVTTAKVEQEALAMLLHSDPAVVHRTVLVSG